MLEEMADKGQHDAVVEASFSVLAMLDLMFKADGLVDVDEVSYCIEIGFGALARSSRPMIDKLKLGVDCILHDHYAVTERGFEILVEMGDPDTWSLVADGLTARVPTSTERERFQLFDCLEAALRRAGRDVEKEAALAISTNHLLCLPYLDYLDRTRRYAEAIRLGMESLGREGVRTSDDCELIKRRLERIETRSGHMAQALAEKDPDRANVMWREQIERLAKRGTPNSYAKAVDCLVELRNACLRCNADAEWREFYSEFRARHSRKTLLVEEMRRLFSGTP